MDRKHSSVNRILEEAAYICGGCKEAAGDIEPTLGYKRRQVEKLKQFATANNLWLDYPNSTITYMAKGGENEVFLNNVLYGIDNKLYFIDTQIRLKTNTLY